jgi:hypothetical protein
VVIGTSHQKYELDLFFGGLPVVIGTSHQKCALDIFFGGLPVVVETSDLHYTSFIIAQYQENILRLTVIKSSWLISTSNVSSISWSGRRGWFVLVS